MRGQQRRRNDNEETLFPVGTDGRAPTVATKLFIACGVPLSTGRAHELVTPGTLRAGTDSPVRRSVGWSSRRTGQRVSDPFGDGSSSLDYICPDCRLATLAVTYVQ